MDKKCQNIKWNISRTDDHTLTQDNLLVIMKLKTTIHKIFNGYNFGFAFFFVSRTSPSDFVTGILGSKVFVERLTIFID